MRSLINFNRLLQVLVMLIISIPSFAQNDAGADKTASSSGNLLAFIMITIALVLAFVIWGLGNILITMSREAMKKKSPVLPSLILLACLGIGIPSQAQDPAIQEAVASTTYYGGLNPTAFWILAVSILIELIAILFLVFMIKRMQAELNPQAATKEFDFGEWWKKVNNKFFTRAVPVEKEADILIDHDYDGIQELDNSLPPWWKYGFYLTIVVSVAYMLYYHVLDAGMNPEQEYAYEMEEAAYKIQQHNATAVDKIDENNIVMPSVAGLEEGKKIYNTACWPCHGKMGEGGAGPNLTDQYWIHKGSLNDIYKSIKIGYPDKGMQSWEKNYSAAEISKLSGYIKSLQGTNPPGAKLAQGDLYVDQPTAGADSAVAKP